MTNFIVRIYSKNDSFQIYTDISCVFEKLQFRAKFQTSVMSLHKK